MPRKNRQQTIETIITNCMKRYFESKVMDLMNTEESWESIDKKLDPMIRQYFKETDYILKKFEPEKYADLTADLSDEAAKLEKSGILHYCIQMEVERIATGILANTKDLDSAVSQISNLYDNYSSISDDIIKFYNIDQNSEDE